MNSIESSFLKTADVQVSDSPMIFKTVLGSCVSVCLWDRVSGRGGMNHYLLPSSPPNNQTTKYGNHSINKLISLMILQVKNRSSIIAKIFGGAKIIDVISDPVGERNILMAKKILAEHSIQIVAEDTGGKKGRFIYFDTRDGKVLVNYR